MLKYPIYKDANRTAAERVKDLLSRMTLEEKVGQMLQLDGLSEFENDFDKLPGSMIQCFGERSKDAIEWARKSRLGIPILLSVDAIHGYSFWPGATMFPTQLGLSCSWSEDLAYKMARATAVEIRDTGAAWVLGPVFCVTRDLRWCRINETFGEDQHLIGRMAMSAVAGLEGDDLTKHENVLACAKHYAGYSETIGGRDSTDSELSQRKLRSWFFPSFERAAREGCGSFMTCYQSIDGIPGSANSWLLRDVLRDEWGYEGIVVTDWRNVDRFFSKQKICENAKEAAAIAINAGNDIMMAVPSFFQGALDAVAEGLVKESLIDEAVARILRVKFDLGLFEDDRYPDIAKAKERIGLPEHRQWALDAARESAVLLENDGILPLKQESYKKIAVIGPNADNPRAQIGSWSLGPGETIEGDHPREASITILDGIKEKFAGEVVHVADYAWQEGPMQHIAEAVDAAAAADLAVVVVGDDTNLSGERNSTATLEMLGGQVELIDRVAASGTPFVVVLVAGKPVVLPKSADKAAAIVNLFNPGMLGGQACAELLFGEINFAGRLTVSWPHHVGQTPVIYQEMRGEHGRAYADMDKAPRYPFGYGISYTSFSYGEPRIEKSSLGRDDELVLSVDVTNNGTMDGVEIVQAYVSDLITSVVWVKKELKGYSRVEIAAGATETVTIRIPVSSCSIVNIAGKRVVEPGRFEVKVGSSSKDEDLQTLPFEVV